MLWDCDWHKLDQVMIKLAHVAPRNSTPLPVEILMKTGQSSQAFPTKAHLNDSQSKHVQTIPNYIDFLLLNLCWILDDAFGFFGCYLDAKYISFYFFDIRWLRYD